MTITVEMYSKLATDANGNVIPIPDAESFLGVVGSSELLNEKCSYVVVTSDVDDLIAIGPDDSEGTPSIPVAQGISRPFAVPRGKGWAVAI
jgi:hypothetical protein